MSSLLDNWIVLFGIPTTIFIENRTWLENSFFKTLLISSSTSTKHVRAFTYQMNRNVQYKRCNNTIIARLWHNMAEHQQSWDINGHSLAYAYFDHVHRSTNFTQCSIDLSRQFLSLRLFENHIAVQADLIVHFLSHLKKHSWTTDHCTASEQKFGYFHNHLLESPVSGYIIYSKSYDETNSIWSASGISATVKSKTAKRTINYGDNDGPAMGVKTLKFQTDVL